MYNWSTDEKKLKKDYPEKYRIWRILQMINYGLDGEKLNGKTLKTFWSEIKDKINDKLIKNYLSFLLNDKDNSNFLSRRTL